MEYEFVFVVDGIDMDDDVAVGIVFDEFDGLLARHRGRHILDVAETGDSAVDAVHRLVVRLHKELPRLRLLRLDPDLVGVSEIAERVGRTRQNISQWVNGERRGDAPEFPDPEGVAGRSLIWRWAEVNDWLAAIGERVGGPGATREDALHIDFMLPRWQQALSDGLPIVHAVPAVHDDDHSPERDAVARLLEGALSAPGVLETISAFPRADQQRLTAICSAPSDRLGVIASRIARDETWGVLAFRGESHELHLIPFAAHEVEGVQPLSELGLGPDATAADLRLALTSELGPDATAEDLQLALTNDELSPPLLAAA